MDSKQEKNGSSAENGENSMDIIRRELDTARRDDARISQELRKLSEDIVQNTVFPPLKDLSAEEANQLVHELRVHQIELEMQNDELIRTQEALEKARASYFELYDLAPVAYITMNDKGLIQKANLTAARMLGTTREALLKRPLSRFVAADDQDRFYLYYLQLMKGNEFPICEMRLIRENGIVLWVRMDAIRTTDKETGTLICRAVMSDITPQKILEEERNSYQHLLNNMFESMPSILVAVDRNGLITRWNAEACRKIGIDEEHALGLPIDQIIPDFACWMDMLRRTLAEQIIMHEEGVAFVSDGNTRYSDVVIYPLIANQQEGAVIRVDDTTDKVMMQDIMLQTQKMMSVGCLAVGMAHEIYNPLSGMLQAAQNIAHRISPDLEQNRPVAEKCGTNIETINMYMQMRNVYEFLHGINASGDRIARIIDSVVRFATYDDAVMTRVKLPVLLEQTLELAAKDVDMKTKYGFEEIEVVRDYAADLPEVCCYPSQIEQVILIVLKNAAQAMSLQEQGGITARITLRVYQDGDKAVMEIEDNGPGMSETVKKHIFEPFYTTKAPGLGIGLGMSVSYYIITNNHKGQILVESHAGEGSRITVCLPYS